LTITSNQDAKALAGEPDFEYVDEGLLILY
jgi:hypothetical protein